MPQLLPFTVFAFNESTGQIVSHHVAAVNGLNAFAVVADQNRDLGLSFVAALDGHRNEGAGVTFPGSALVSVQTVLEQPDVFGAPPEGTDLPEMTFTTTVVFIHVKALADKADLDFEDKRVGGIYVASIDAGIPVNALANAALDGFHSSTPISCLDHFKIEVRTTSEPTSELLASAEGYVDYQFERAARIVAILGSPESATLVPPTAPVTRKRMKP